MQRAAEVQVGVVMRARAMAVVLCFAKVALAVASVHLDPALRVGGRMALMAGIRRWIDSAPQALVVVGGDWSSRRTKTG